MHFSVASRRRWQMGSSPELALLTQWVQHGLIEPIDLGFAEFLARQSPGEAPEVLLAAALTSRQYGLGHTCLDLAALIDNPVALLGLELREVGSLPVKALAEGLMGPEAPWQLNRLLPALETSRVIGTTRVDRPLVLDAGRLYLTRNWRNEETVARAIQTRLQAIDPSPFDAPAFLDRLFSPRPAALGPNIQKVACALATRAKLLLLTGGPGTGKTYTVVRILALLLHRQMDLRILLSAPTGKAAARLTESITRAFKDPEIAALDPALLALIPTKATTLHQMLGARRYSRAVRHDEREPLSCDVVVVDEASMIDLDMMAALVRAVPPEALLILVGDKDQLASVEAGYVLGDLCQGAADRGYSPATLDWIEKATGEVIAPLKTQSGNALSEQTVMLRHSERFDARSGIGQLAEAVNQGDADQAIRIIGTGGFGDLSWIENHRPDPRQMDALCLGMASAATPFDSIGFGPYLQMIHALDRVPESFEEQMTLFREVLDAFARFQVLCAVREGPYGVDHLNRMMLERLERHQKIRRLRGSDSEWFSGRPVMATRNDYELGIMNGDVGITLPFQNRETGERSLRVVFKDTENEKKPFKIVLPSRLTDLETVFAMTVHKSQGSEFGHVLLMLPDPGQAVNLSRELLYTGITRARERLTLIGGDLDHLRQIIVRQTRRGGRLAEIDFGEVKTPPV